MYYYHNQVLAREYQYKEVANLLDAVKQLMAHFDQYTEIPLVFDLQKRIDAIQNDLTTQVHRAFREIGQLIDSVADLSVIMQGLPGHLRSISDACLVVDALGGDARRALLAEFVDLQLLPYEQMLVMINYTVHWKRYAYLCYFISSYSLNFHSFYFKISYFYSLHY